MDRTKLSNMFIHAIGYGRSTRLSGFNGLNKLNKIKEYISTNDKFDKCTVISNLNTHWYSINNNYKIAGYLAAAIKESWTKYYR